METELQKISNKKYIFKYLLPTIFLSLFLLASVISCAVIAPNLIAPMALMSLVALGIFAIFMMIASCMRGSGRGGSTNVSWIDGFCLGMCCNESVNSDCGGGSSSSNDAAGCCIMIGIVIIGIVILIGLALVIGEIIGTLALAGGSLVALFSKERTREEKKRFGVLFPITVCCMGAFTVPLVFLGLYIKKYVENHIQGDKWSNIFSDLGKSIGEAPKLYKILFSTLIGVSFLLLIGWTIYCMISREFNLAEAIDTVFNSQEEERVSGGNPHDAHPRLNANARTIYKRYSNIPPQSSVNDISVPYEENPPPYESVAQQT